mgnify:FL=1|tara:strand:- start:504 stop:968 length:465 start_codon:yes stop_codon:yes gene_type:complete
MKIVTKNYSLKNGKRSYLVYLKDQNDNSLECYDIYGDEERLRKEEELSEKYEIDTINISYVSLEKFKEDEDPIEKPLFLVFYLSKDLFTNKELVAAYGENVKKYLDEKGDNVRLFFMPTDGEEKIVCINPLYINTKDEYNKIDSLIKELENQLV